MAGRPKDSCIEKLEKKIRTITWFKTVLSSSKKSNATQFMESEYGDGLRKWSNYSNGESTPTKSTLNQIENLLLGTREAFVNGPRDSLLFQCMFDDIEDLICNVEFDQDFFFWLSPIVHEISYIRMEDFELNEIVLILEQIYKEKKIFEPGEYLSDAPESYLTFLSGSIIILRFSINRDTHARNSYVADILNIIFHIIEKPDVKNTLIYYSINELFKEWLYITIEDWSNNSVTGDIFTTAGIFPSKEEFLKAPSIFHYELLKANEECAHLCSGEKKEIEYANSLTLSKKQKWFEEYKDL